MPLMIKPRTLGVLAKAERRKVGAAYIVTAMGLFDLARPDAERFENDQSLWLLAAKALPKGSFLDIGMPKPQAELLIGGSAHAPGGEPTAAMVVEWAVGPLHKRLLVFGDRYWNMAGSGYVPTPPSPFVDIPLGPERAFGGPDHPDNPRGLGFRAAERIVGRELVALPNIEMDAQLISSIDSQPPPALCGPTDLASPKRRRLAGTYDAHWLKHVAPALPDDVDPRLFLAAPEDQIFPGYLSGGEPYALRGFSADAPELRGTLPTFRVRCFLARKGPASGASELVEMAMKIDTLWLFAGARRGVLIYRGALPVQDIDAADLTEVMLAYERGSDEPRSFEHYVEVWNLRRDRENGFKYAFAESQLAPSLSPETIVRRNAERAALAQERQEAHRAARAWMIERQLAKSDLPKALWPAIVEPKPDADPVDFPLPTPEELESGEIDLAAILGASEALQAALMEKADALRAKRDEATQATKALRAPGASPEAVDGLFAALDSLDGQKPTAILDQAAALQLPAMPDAVSPEQAAEIAAKIGQVTDWRRAILNAAKPPTIDEEVEFQAARARFLDLPEGRPLAQARKALASAKIEFPELPSVERPVELSVPAEPTSRFDLDALLDGLDQESRVPPTTGETIRAKFQQVDDQLRRSLPNLAPEGGSALDALMALGASAAPPQKSPEDALRYAAAKRDEVLAQTEASLDARESELSEGLARMRRAAPTPLYPKQPMTRPLARRFGDLIIAEWHAGLDLRGRDLAGADLRGADFAGADLEGALLEQADLSGARLAGARLVDAALTGAMLDAADLSDADLSGANLNKCSAKGANFARCRLAKLSPIDPDFSGARFDGATFSSVTLMNGTLDEAVFAGAKMEDVILMRVSLARTVWDGANLEKIQFVDLPIDGASFRGARLFRCAFLKSRGAGSDFSDADLTRSSFLGEADLRGSRFDRAVGADSTFVGAKLQGASFVEGTFNRTTFGEADLTGANFRLASLKRSIFSSAKLVHADVIGANLLNAQLRRADLSGARLLGANLYASNLDHAKIQAADLSGANLAKTFLAVDTNAG